MSKYSCKNCSQTVDVKENLVGVDIFTDEIFKCKNCGAYVSSDELSTEDRELEKSIYRNYHHSSRVKSRLTLIFLLLIIVGYSISLWLK